MFMGHCPSINVFVWKLVALRARYPSPNRDIYCCHERGQRLLTVTDDTEKYTHDVLGGLKRVTDSFSKKAKHDNEQLRVG